LTISKTKKENTSAIAEVFLFSKLACLSMIPLALSEPRGMRDAAAVAGRYLRALR
jgi:hypothetical protein